MTIADKLLLLNSTKTAIAVAIEDKGVTVGAIPFSQYPAKIAEISGGGGDGDWTRPADWLPLPEVLPTEQKFVGLYAVEDDDSNFVALFARGAYTVDWGDGVVESFADSSDPVVAQHQYNFASLPDESLCSRGYKQVVVTLTPQSGQNLTRLGINTRPTGFSNGSRTLQWLDITISLPLVTSLSIGGTVAARLNILERCTVITIGSFASAMSMFEGCVSLQSVPLFDTSSVTTMTNMFQGCTSLRSVPLFNTSAVLSFVNMFNGCVSLQSVPLFDTSSVTTMGSMFSGCSSLQYVPLFNMEKNKSINSMFLSCLSLKSVPLFNTSAVTNMLSAFSNCQSLRYAPSFDFSGVPSGSNLFTACSSLRRSSITGVSFTISYNNCNLSATALNEVFTNLATVTGQTITITNNPGAATCDRTIATAKGWTVTG